MNAESLPLGAFFTNPCRWITGPLFLTLITIDILSVNFNYSNVTETELMITSEYGTQARIHAMHDSNSIYIHDIRSSTAKLIDSVIQ